MWDVCSIPNHSLTSTRVFDGLQGHQLFFPFTRNCRCCVSTSQNQADLGRGDPTRWWMFVIKGAVVCPRVGRAADGKEESSQVFTSEHNFHFCGCAMHQGFTLFQLRIQVLAFGCCEAPLWHHWLRGLLGTWVGGNVRHNTLFCAKPKCFNVYIHLHTCYKRRMGSWIQQMHNKTAAPKRATGLLKQITPGHYMGLNKKHSQGSASFRAHGTASTTNPDV